MTAPIDTDRTTPVAGVADPGGRPHRGRLQKGIAARATCKHCDTPFAPTEERSEYCCAGCEYVHRLITGRNLDRFYSLRRGAAGPVRPVVFQPRDLRWLEGLVQRAESLVVGRISDPPSGSGGSETRPTCALDLDLQGVSCVGCVWLIEKIWRDWPGTRELQLNATLGRVTLRWAPGECDVVGFARELQKFGYLVGPASGRARTESQSLLLRMGLCAAFALNGMLFSLPAYLGMQADFMFARLFTGLSFLFAAASVVVGGTYFFGRSWQSLRRGVLHIDLPISIGILAGFAGSVYAWTQAAANLAYFDFVSTFTFLMLVGRWTQLVAVERNRHRLLGLQDNLPDVRLLEDDASTGHAVPGANDPGTASAMPAAEVTLTTAVVNGHRAVTTKAVRSLVRGDRFVVASGEIIPVSGSLLGPAGSLGMDWINGESEARAVLPGQIIESGAVNLSPHELRVEALEPWEASLLARLLAARPSSESRNRALERVIRVYLAVVLVLAAVGAAAWFIATRDVPRTLQVAVSVLVVSCPCALGVTLPLIDELVVARLRKFGVFVQSVTLWPRLRRVRKVIFDKTGTLTLESLVLRNPRTLESLAANARSALWTMVRSARHPVAACIRESMLARDLVDETTTDAAVREEVGLGLELQDAEGLLWRLGRLAWVKHAGTDLVSVPMDDLRGGAEQSSGPTDSGNVDVAFGCGGEVVACFTTDEEVREDAVTEVGQLRCRGLEVAILSGDRRAKVTAMARRLGLPSDAAVGEMTPADKESWVRQLDHQDTMMIGDGANDSLAFAAAYCRGTPAIERGLLEHRSDFFFLGRGLAGIGRLIDASTKRYATILSVFAFAVAYNLVAVAFALAGAMSPLLAAVLMPASALVSLAIAVVGLRRL